MDMESGVPPGFRFHPTEEELVGYYLKRKINALKIDLDVIVDIDLYKIEPWDIQEKCKLGYDEQNEWYFFSHKDRKYPTGTRTNRATAAGFWKATGRDKAVLSKNKIIGMRKTLVYYKGRAPNGMKTDWIMHEYRLQTSEHGPPQEEGWVVCRAFWKRTPSQRQGFDAWNNAYYMRDNDLIKPPTLPEGRDTHRLVHADQSSNYYQLFGSGHEIYSNNTALDSQLLDIPQLDSPTISTSLATKGIQPNAISTEDYDNDRNHNTNQYIDWKNLDNLLGSHLASDSVSSISHSSYMLPMPHSYQPDTQDHVSNCLGYPDL